MKAWNKLKSQIRASPKKLYEYIRSKDVVVVAVNVSATNSSGSSAANPALIGATVIGIVPAGNQDQFIGNVEVEADGKVKVTLAAAATAQNQFKVSVKPA